MLDAGDIEGVFDDNSFTLVPGTAKNVKFFTTAKISANELQKIISIKYLNH